MVIVVVVVLSSICSLSRYVCPSTLLGYVSMCMCVQLLSVYPRCLATYVCAISVCLSKVPGYMFCP